VRPGREKGREKGAKRARNITLDEIIIKLNQYDSQYQKRGPTLRPPVGNRREKSGKKWESSANQASSNSCSLQGDPANFFAGRQPP
jgi:hypothetical protein